MHQINNCEWQALILSEYGCHILEQHWVLVSLKNIINLDEIMKFQETENTELYREFNESVTKEIVAFLSTHDGVIYIGV